MSDPELLERGFRFNPLRLPDPVVRAAAWIRTVPELSTRPMLVAAMAEDNRLRRRVMNLVEELVSVADPLYGLPHAEKIIGLLYVEGRKALERLERRIEDKGTRAELMGLYRNVYRNVLSSLHDGESHIRARSTHDILRVHPIGYYIKPSPKRSR